MRKREVSTIELPLESASFRLILGAKKRKSVWKNHDPIYILPHIPYYKTSIVGLSFCYHSVCSSWMFHANGKKAKQKEFWERKKKATGKT